MILPAIVAGLTIGTAWFVGYGVGRIHGYRAATRHHEQLWAPADTVDLTIATTDRNVAMNRTALGWEWAMSDDSGFAGTMVAALGAAYTHELGRLNR